jgi:pyruvate dehydrogenase E2 component (dihydrolipoamide acetyltransferase)
MAKQAGLDLTSIAGSGPHGRIVKNDIDAALARPVPAAAKAPAAAVAAPPATADYEEVPHNAMRKTIARRLGESKRTVPHFYLSIDCELDRLTALRKDLNGRSDAYRISVNDFVIRAAALTLRKHPEVNSQWTDTAILRHKRIDVSVAVALDGGLITPVVRDADRKGLAEIAGEMKDLAARARAGKLMPEEYQGGTFSISNLGMFGIDEFVAVINPPQAAILALGAGAERPVVRDGALAIATVMTATMSCDHRVFGGAEGAAYLQTFKQLIEDPITMLL